MLNKILARRGHLFTRLAPAVRSIVTQKSFGTDAVHDDKKAFKNMIALVKRNTGCPLSMAINAVKQAASYEEAIKFVAEDLKKAGAEVLSKPADLSSRREGLICVVEHHNGLGMAILECSTDFMSATAEFREILELSSGIASDLGVEDNAIHSIPISKILEIPLKDEATGPNQPSTLGAKLSQVAATSGETLVLKDAYCVKIAQARNKDVCYVYGFYIHSMGNHPSNFGKIGSTIILKIQNGIDGKLKILKDFANKLACHIVGCRPSVVMADQASPAESKTSGRILAGEALLEQEYLFDETNTVQEVLQTLGAELGAEISVEGFKLVEI